MLITFSFFVRRINKGGAKFVNNMLIYKNNKIIISVRKEVVLMLLRNQILFISKSG